MSDRTFQALYAGKIASLKICVNVGMTNARRDAPDQGVWEINRDQFIKIAESIQASLRFKEFSIERIAEVCDETGIDNRFFRLNQEVADWIDENHPVAEIDFMVT